MSDETGPALSRRALREQRRAEAEAQLAREAEELGRTPAPSTGITPAVPAPAQSPAANPAVSAPQATAAKPAAAKPAASKPVAAKPTAAKLAAAKPAVKPAAPDTAAPKATPAAAKPAAAQPASVAPVTTSKTVEPAADSAQIPTRSRRAAGGEVDALPERATLQRARDREALRTRRRLEQEVSNLSVNEPSPGDDPAPLTRKQLRLQMLQEAAGNVASAPKAATPGTAKPAAGKPVAGKPVAGKPSDSKAPAGTPATAKSVAKPAAGKSVPEVEQVSVEEALALRRRSGGGAPINPAPTPVQEDLGDVDLEVLAQQRELAARAAIIGRRAAERQRLEESNSARAGARRSDPFTGAMHHLRDEDSERAFINTGISGPETRGFHISMTDQGTIVEAPAKSSPTVAPKAPVTKAPASKAGAPKNSAVSAPAPTAKPAEKPAAATPAQAAPVASKATGAKPAAAAASAARAPQTGPAATKPKAAAKSAPAAATAAKPAPKVQAPAPDVEPEVTHPPVRAVRAQGLEPLDAQTAGMRRANNMYLMVIAALSVGGAALVAGLIMILNSN